MNETQEFDKLKTQVLKYVLYKKRTEAEIRQKFSQSEESMLDDVIQYLQENNYINDDMLQLVLNKKRPEPLLVHKMLNEIINSQEM